MDAAKMEKYDLASCTLMDWFALGISRGYENVDAQELGEVADIIKDMAQAKKYCLEAEYYKTVTEAMKEKSEEPYGYSTPKVRRPYMNQEKYVDEYLNDPDFVHNMRYGYTDWNNDRYGKAYNEYQTAKRHYTETNSKADKDEMTVHMNEHLMDSLATFRDMWKNADPDMKKRMKTDLSALVGEMVV